MRCEGSETRGQWRVYCAPDAFYPRAEPTETGGIPLGSSNRDPPGSDERENVVISLDLNFVNLLRALNISETQLFERRGQHTKIRFGGDDFGVSGEIHVRGRRGFVSR